MGQSVEEQLEFGGGVVFDIMADSTYLVKCVDEIIRALLGPE